MLLFFYCYFSLVYFVIIVVSAQIILRCGSKRQVYIKLGSVPLICNKCGVHAMQMLKNVENHFSVGLSLIKEILSQLVDIELVD